MSLTHIDVFRIMETLEPAQGPIPAVALLPGERMTRAGHLFPGHEALVHLVAGGMKGEGDLFRAVPHSGVQMTDRLDRADAWDAVARHLRMMAQRAEDCALIDRSTAVI